MYENSLEDIFTKRLHVSVLYQARAKLASCKSLTQGDIKRYGDRSVFPLLWCEEFTPRPMQLEEVVGVNRSTDMRWPLDVKVNFSWSLKQKVVEVTQK
jgi:hypothetical protein